MARKHEAVSWLQQGLSPGQIAERMGVSVDTVMGYLYNQVGEGVIRRSDILLSIGENTRQVVESVEQEHGKLDRWQFKRIAKIEYATVNADEALVYRDLRKPEVYLGDTYWYLYSLEAVLHAYIQRALMAAYGNDWWRSGVPESIRAECAATRERDPEPAAEPYCYTTLIHVKEIIDRRWGLFSKLVAKGPASKKAEFLAWLTRINHIRNRVMHAAKGMPPDENDFRVLKEFITFADFGNWVTADDMAIQIENRETGTVQ